MNRRHAIKWLSASALGFGGGILLFSQTQDHEPAMLSPGMKRRGLIRPPGSVDEDEFRSLCIRCQRCAQVCEPGAIRLLPGSSRLAGTPVIVPEQRACNLCMRCGEACPTAAILVLETKAQADMGEAVVDEDLCVSHNKSGICGACFTVCPLRGKAIKLGLHNSPTVFPKECVGCGLCEEVCIVTRDRAIRVHTNRSWA